MEKEDKKQVLVTSLVYGGIVLLIPAVIGVIFYFLNGNIYVLESMYVVFGCLGLLFVLGRSRRRDTKNYKQNRTVIVDEKEDTASKSYKAEQWMCVIIALSAFLIAGILFLIFSKTGH